MEDKVVNKRGILGLAIMIIKMKEEIEIFWLCCRENG